MATKKKVTFGGVQVVKVPTGKPTGHGRTGGRAGVIGEEYSPEDTTLTIQPGMCCTHAMFCPCHNCLKHVVVSGGVNYTCTKYRHERRMTGGDVCDMNTFSSLFSNCVICNSTQLEYDVYLQVEEKTFHKKFVNLTTKELDQELVRVVNHLRKYGKM